MIYILIIFIAILNAFMDIVENENFFESKLKNLNQKFWYKRESWKYAKKVFKYKIDSWHLSKSLMVILICIAISPNSIVNCIILGIIWNIVFNIFYNHIFK